MKIQLLITTLFLLIALSTFAQEANERAVEIASKQTAWMNDNLDLSAEQLEKVKDLNLVYTSRMIKILDSTEKLNKIKQAKNLAEEKDTKIKHILNHEQYEKYEDKKNEMRSKAKEMYANRNTNKNQ